MLGDCLFNKLLQQCSWPECCLLSESWQGAGYSPCCAEQRVAGPAALQGSWSTLRGQSCRSPRAPRALPERSQGCAASREAPAAGEPHTASHSPRGLHQTKGLGGVTAKMGLKGLCTNTHWAFNRPGHQTGPNTSFERKAIMQTSFYLLVHAHLPCPIAAGHIFLPACLSCQPPPFSFPLSLLIYFCPFLKEYLSCLSPVWAGAWGLRHRNCPSTCRQGSAKVGSFTYSSRYFPRIVFSLSTSAIPTTLSRKEQAAQLCPAGCCAASCCSAESRRPFGFPRSRVITRQGFKGNVITHCLVHWTTAASSCFPGLFFSTLNTT